MKLFRITTTKYAGDLSGEGAEKHGGRWNSMGKKIVYCASTPSMALIETLAWTPLSSLLSSGFVLSVFKYPDDSVLEISPSELPEDWIALDSYPKTQKLGDQWLIEAKSLLLKVPSAILSMESNVLINPAHPMKSSILHTDSYDLVLDKRLFDNIQK